MKIALIILLLLPLLSFGQISEQDKNSIDEYTLSMCGCINDLIGTLHPKTIDVILMMAEKENEVAMNEMAVLLSEMSPEETEEFLASFEIMESQDFSDKIDVCGNSDALKTELLSQIEDEDDVAFEYFLEVISREDACKIMKSLYELGKANEE